MGTPSGDPRTQGPLESPWALRNKTSAVNGRAQVSTALPSTLLEGSALVQATSHLILGPKMSVHAVLSLHWSCYGDGVSGDGTLPPHTNCQVKLNVNTGNRGFDRGTLPHCLNTKLGWVLPIERGWGGKERDTGEISL